MFSHRLVSHVTPSAQIIRLIITNDAKFDFWSALRQDVRYFVHEKRQNKGTMISHTFSQVIRGQKRSLKVVGTSFRSFSQSSANVFVSHTTTTSSHVSQKVYSPESSKVTEMVDDLLKYTRSLMDGSRHHIVAYSGGIDSSLVAMLIQKSAQSDESVRAVLGLSLAVPTEQISLTQ